MENRIKDTEQIKKMLETIDPEYLMYAVSQMNEIFVPQWYNNDHAEMYGFEDVNEMREVCNEEYYLYDSVDYAVRDIQAERS